MNDLRPLFGKINLFILIPKRGKKSVHIKLLPKHWTTLSISNLVSAKPEAKRHREYGNENKQQIRIQ